MIDKILIGVIMFYRNFISFFKPPCCRFTPTCSQYALDAVSKHGALKGVFLTLVRLSKCHPFNKGGYDPVP